MNFINLGRKFFDEMLLYQIDSVLSFLLHDF
jgi:hypothetical protein